MQLGEVAFKMSKLLKPLSEKSFIFEGSNLPEEIENIILNSYLTTEDKLRSSEQARAARLLWTGLSRT